MTENVGFVAYNASGIKLCQEKSVCTASLNCTVTSVDEFEIIAVIHLNRYWNREEDSYTFDVTLPVSNLTGSQILLKRDEISSFVNSTTPGYCLEKTIPLDKLSFVHWEVQPEFSLKTACGIVTSISAYRRQTPQWQMVTYNRYTEPIAC